MKRAGWTVVVAGCAALAALLAAGGRAKAADPSGKIAARVIADTADGKTAEALVVLREQADLGPADDIVGKAAKGRYVVDALRATADSTQGPIRALLDQRGIRHQPFSIVNMIKVEGDAALMLELAGRSDVARIDANPRVRTDLPLQTGVDASATRAVEWNVTKVKAPSVWALGFKGEGRVVADADTGVDWDHPSLKSHYRGWNGASANHNFNWHDATTQQSTVPVDPHGHGTFTTSQMVGDDGAGNQVGVAPGAKWIGCRNMDATGTGTPSTYTECFEWLIAPYPIGGTPSQGDPSLAPDAINNSWGCPPSEGCNQQTLKAIVQAVRAAGIVSAVSAGNSGSACKTIVDPPAIYDESFSVGATTSTDAIASFSSRGPVRIRPTPLIKPDVSAPGSNIRGAVPGTGYQSGWSGTSMAAPHVAGGVALVWQAKPFLIGDVAGTEALFTATTVRKTSTQNCGGTPGSSIPNNTFGWGILDLLAAVDAP
jgi:subtilisin family serine protease